MTDLTSDIQGLLDESYESDLTEEENEELLLMCGHNIGPGLSRAAQAVLDAATQEFWGSNGINSEARCAAGVLRVAAEQIEDLYCESDIDDSDGVVFALRQLMLIADELNHLND